MENELKLIITKDGSHSIYNPQLNETYHSVGGAMEESQFVYINEGLKYFCQNRNEIKILEVGFGTGLNAILTLKEVLDGKMNISYSTLEPYPLKDEITSQLNYPLYFSSFLKDKFYYLHSSPWNERLEIIPDFIFTKHQVRLEDFESREKFDLVYYDAFAPSKQAEIWDLSNLIKIRNMMENGGILVTYCSSGKFKRDLKEAGFSIESLPGPLGKREITRARAIGF